MDERFLQKFSTKLYHPADIEGRKNVETIQFLRELETALEGHPEFVGIAFYGSTMKGYSRKESDIDYTILYDNPEEDEIPDRLVPPIYDFTKKHNFPNFFSQNVNIESLKTQLSSSYPIELYEGTENAAMLFKNLVGAKAKVYRSLIVEKIKQFGSKQKERVIKEIIARLHAVDGFSSHKILKRTGIDQENLEAALEKRKKLWEKRVRKYFSEEES